MTGICPLEENEYFPATEGLCRQQQLKAPQTVGGTVLGGES